MESLKKLVSDFVPIKYHPFKLYTQEGLLLRNLNRVEKNFTNIFYVANRRHWMWPPTKIGHEFFPKYVYEDEVNDENDLLQSNSRKNGNKESVISMKTLSLSPKVFLIENFLSEDEIEYLVNYGKKHLAPSHVGIGKEVVNKEFKLSYFDNGEVKTNDLTKLGTNVVAINDPVASITNYLYETMKNEEKRNAFRLTIRKSQRLEYHFIQKS